MRYPYLVFRYEFDAEFQRITKCEPAFTVYAESGEKATMIASDMYPDEYLGMGHTTWRLYYRWRAKDVPCLNPEAAGILPNTASRPTAPSSPAGEDQGDSRRGGLC